MTRFLRQAATLTPEQWTEIYWRYVKEPKILKAVRIFDTVAGQAFLERQKRIPLEELGTRDPVVMRVNARIEQIVAVLPEIELDSKRGGHLRQRAAWVIVEVNQALENADLLNEIPEWRTAVQTFLTLFEGMIEFPEFACDHAVQNEGRGHRRQGLRDTGALVLALPASRAHARAA